MLRYSLLLSALIFFLNAYSQASDCATASAASFSLPLTLTGESTCLAGNNHNTSNSPTCGNNTFKAGDDKFYSFTPAQSGNILIETIVSGGGVNYGIFLYAGCPDTGLCVVNNTAPSELGNGRKIVGVDIIAGVNYFLVIDNASPCFAFNLEISAPDLNCTSPVITVANNAFNADFEDSSLVGWKFYRNVDDCCPVRTFQELAFPANNRFRLTSGNGFDPLTDKAITVVAPGGGRHSVKLGNSGNGNQAERMSYKFLVTPQTNGLIYKYAMVLEDPGHPTIDQPGFELKILDGTGTLVDACGRYKVTAGSGIPCFITIPDLDPSNTATSDVVYRPWTAVGVDLSDYLGDSVTVEFTTNDCGAGAHFGYGYFDVSLTALEILVDGALGNDVINNSGFCVGDDSITLSAPIGFASYQWSTGETTNQIVIKNPIPGQLVSVQFNQLNGFSCGTSLIKELQPNPTPAVDFIANGCVGEPTTFENITTIDNGLNLSHRWIFDDGTNSDLETPNPINYATGGAHTATLYSATDSGCADSITKTFTVEEPYVANLFSTSDAVIDGDAITLEAQITNGNGPFIYEWTPNIGSGSGPYQVSPAQETQYILNVTDEGRGGCQYQSDTVLIRIETDFFFNVPNAFSPNIDGQNDGFRGKGVGVNQYSFVIFNRWGEEVFSTSDIDIAWDGTDGGDKLAVAGVYTFIVNIVDFKGVSHQYSGPVTLLR
jgi:gliding motility-associated-like protein